MKTKQKTIKDLDVSILDGDRGKNYPHQDEISKEGYCLFLSANNVTKKGFNFNETSYISKEKDETLRGGKIQRNDIIITTRGTVGNIAYYDDLIPYENIRINSGMLIVRCGGKLNSKYIYYALKSRQFQNQIKSIQTGSAQPQLPKSHFVQMKLPVPSLNIQNRIANILWLLDQKINTNIRINDNLEQQEALEQYKAALKGHIAYVHNALQTMDCVVDSNFEIEFSNTCSFSQFNKFHYHLSKLPDLLPSCELEQDSNWTFDFIDDIDESARGYGDPIYARLLLKDVADALSATFNFDFSQNNWHLWLQFEVAMWLSENDVS